MPGQMLRILVNRSLSWTVAIVFLLGCGSGESDLDRKAVFGTVERNGKPVKDASIGFLPAEGHSGPAANTAVQDGEYAFTEANGPVPGPHRVRISIAPSKDALLQSSPNRRPQSEWQFEATVPEDGDYQKNFTLD